jgi:hypothetical protein
MGKIQDFLIRELLKGLISVLFFGCLLTIITYLLIIPSLNPNPEVEPSCKKTEGGIILSLYNNGRVPAEEFNIQIYEEYNGGASFYPNYVLCDVTPYDSKTTLVHCDYIPPKSIVKRELFFENKTKSRFGYSLWGRTTPLEVNQILYCF